MAERLFIETLTRVAYLCAVIDPATIFSSRSRSEFERVALETFAYQSVHCRVYAEFIGHLGINPASVTDLSQVPFLPVEFFKNHTVMADGMTPGIVFTSSGTTGMVQSRHPVADVSLYEASYLQGFREFYGEPGDYVFLALLPSYREREGSSLIYMVDGLIRRCAPGSGYVLHDPEKLSKQLLQLATENRKTILMGVTYALLDLVEQFPVEFPDLIVMETGGMKGRRKEMIREELHARLCEGFGVPAIHSEYGMTELLSQGYSTGEGIFRCPPWMRVLTRDMYDPAATAAYGHTGGINVIDLANRYSCAFIATQDLGRVYEDGSFEVLGRFDNSDVRGCNLLVQ